MFSLGMNVAALLASFMLFTNALAYPPTPIDTEDMYQRWKFWLSAPLLFTIIGLAATMVAALYTSVVLYCGFGATACG